MADKIGSGSPFGTTGPNQPRTPAPRHDVPGSVGAFDPVASTSGVSEPRTPAPRRDAPGAVGAFDPVGAMTGHVAGHVMHGSSAPDSFYGVNSSHGMPKKGFADFHKGDAGKGTNYEPPGDAGEKA